MSSKLNVEASDSPRPADPGHCHREAGEWGRRWIRSHYFNSRPSLFVALLRCNIEWQFGDVK
eukprot:scaffold2885_cov155-Skeletonema_marinoi.AAC.2